MPQVDAEKVPAQSGAASGSSGLAHGAELFKLLVTTEFPFPIAHGFRQAMEEKESREKACALLHTALEFLGSVLISDHLSSEDRNPDLDTALLRILEAPPSAGVWWDLARRILEDQERRSRTPFLPVLSSLLAKPARKELSQLLEWRNRWAHSGVSFDLGLYRRTLIGLLDRIQLLRQVSLICPDTGRLHSGLYFIETTLLKGDNPSFPRVECRSDLALEAGQLVLYANHSRDLLPLHPLMLFAPCERCPDRHFFQFNRVTNRKASYSSIPGGHEKISAENYLLLEQLLRQSKARRVHPRHFSLPGDFSGVARTLRAGDRVGPYQVEELLKLGGMSQIYRVTDTRTGRSFALKLLPLELARDPVLLLRFEEEAQNLKTLKHPHVASLVDLGEDFGDRYLVLDLALGGKIGSQSCSDLSEVQGPLPEKLIIEIGKQVCDGLHYVHSQGIVHRDLKPGNLLVAGDRILITDFGISRARGTNRITLTGMPVGTAEYMAPEQLQEKEVDHRADIYSLGCTLYELATGRPPYHADTPLTTALHHLQAAPLRVDALNGRISRGLSNIIFKAIQKRPQLRYQSAWQLFEDLARFQQDPAGHQVIEGEQTPQDAREEAARGKARFKRRLLASAAALLILVAAGFWGEKAVRGWRLHRSLDQAQSVWSQGKARWPEVCQILARLYEEAPAHPEVQAFLHQISATGSLVVRAQPPGATIQVVPRPDEDRSLGISLEPRVLQGRDPAGTGGRFVLAPGHYQVSIALGKLACEFPVFISQSRYEATVGGWKEGQRLRPEEVAEWQPAQQKDSNGFTLAEEQTIGPVVLIEVPEGYSYVTPGPFWYSLPENLRTAEKLEGKPDWFKALGARQFNWRSADLEEGFLIGQDEVSVEEFDRWFRRFGREAFEWPGRWQTRRLLAIAEGIPPEVLEKCWGVGPGDRSGENGRRRTREEVCEAKARSDPINQKWIEYHEKLRQSLEVQLQGDRKLPVVDVNFDIALTYARTHDLEPAGELKAWLASEVRSSKALLARLAELEGRLAGDNAPDIEASSIPRDIQVPERRQSPRGSRRINLLEAYGSSWIYSEAEFASQVPVQAILVWATANKDRLSTFRGRLVEIGMKLSGDPWFHFVRDDECRNLVHTYVKELGDEDDRLNAAENEPQQPANSAGGGKAPGRPLIEREHFRRWLGMRIREETGNLAERAKLLGKLEEEPGVDRQSLEVPWEFRLEYGRASGRSLPSIPQWERAFRGADTRRFPWGNSAVPGLACTGPHREGPRSLERYRVGGDRSPYGVWSLAGNVSEWVLPSPELRDEGYQFLKGGNWFHSVIYADAGCLLAIQPMLRGEYAGFRVIRTIRALAVEPVAVSSGE